MNKLFIQDLKSSPYYMRIFKNHEIIMLYLSGSRLINVVDEHSDYDLVALTNEQTCNEHLEEYLTYDGIKVHWHYIPVTKFICNEGGTAMSCFGQAQFCKLTDDNIIYENPKYLDVIEYLKLNKDTVSQVAARRLAEYHRELIRDILLAGVICKENHCKFLYHLCYASYLLFGDEPNKQLLAEIKRIRWKPVCEELKTAAVQRIAILRDYVDSNPCDIARQTDEFNRGLNCLLI